jgi:predicted phage-related endonuclease
MTATVWLSGSTKEIARVVDDVKPIINQIDELERVRKALKALEATEKALKANITELLGDDNKIIVNGEIRLEIKSVERTDISRDMLKNNFPEVWEAVIYKNSYSKIVIN